MTGVGHFKFSNLLARLFTNHGTPLPITAGQI